MSKQPNVIHMEAYTQEREHLPRMRESIEGTKSAFQDIQQMTQILGIAQLLCEEGPDGLERLCSEIQRATQDRAYLLPGGRLKLVEAPSSISLSLPIQFGSSFYGTLCVSSDLHHPEQPALSLPVAQLLAQVCGWLLHTFEQSAFLNGQSKRLEYFVHGSLTRREREVLSLMYQGYSREEIVDTLCITPATLGKHLHHIYGQLGVHSEHDALLVAYLTGVFSVGKQNKRRNVYRETK